MGSFFDPCVNALGRRPYCPLHMEVSYCTFGFSTIIQRDLRTLSLPRDSPRNNQYACVILVHAGKATHAYLTKLFGGLSQKKSGGTISHLHTWWQDGRHNRFPFNFINEHGIHHDIRSLFTNEIQDGFNMDFVRLRLSPRIGLRNLNVKKWMTYDLGFCSIEHAQLCPRVKGCARYCDTSFANA